MNRASTLVLTLSAALLLGINEDCSPDNDDDGWTADTGDCDDEDASINPGAEEVCGDGVDNNCDGFADEDCGGGATCPMDGCWVDWWEEVFYLDSAPDGTLSGTLQNALCVWDVSGRQDGDASPAVLLDLDLRGQNSACAAVGTFELDWVGTDCDLMRGQLFVIGTEQEAELYPCDQAGRHPAGARGRSPLLR